SGYRADADTECASEQRSRGTTSTRLTRRSQQGVPLVHGVPGRASLALFSAPEQTLRRDLALARLGVFPCSVALVAPGGKQHGLLIPRPLRVSVHVPARGRYLPDAARPASFAMIKAGLAKQ